MRLTSFTDYGLRMLMLMAGSPDRPFSTADMADELKLSRNHLSKIMQRLSRANIIKTRRGGGGGAVLADRPENFRLGQIVRLLEEDQPLVECFSEGKIACSLFGNCGLTKKLRAAEASFLAELDKSTLADISI